MRRCRLPFCRNARGHSQDSHDVIRSDGKRLGMEASRRAFAKDYQLYMVRLTAEEKRVIREYEMI